MMWACCLGAQQERKHDCCLGENGAIGLSAGVHLSSVCLSSTLPSPLSPACSTPFGRFVLLVDAGTLSDVRIFLFLLCRNLLRTGFLSNSPEHYETSFNVNLRSSGLL